MLYSSFSLLAARGIAARAFGAAGALRSCFGALACVLPLAAFAQVEVVAPWVRATVPHQPATGAFMQLRADQDQKLVAADSPLAKAVELHEMRMEQDIMRMRQVPEIALPAGQVVALQPGGYHIMLIGLQQQMQAGQTVPLTLTLEAADGKRSTVAVQAEVRALNAGAATQHGHAAESAPAHHHSGSHNSAHHAHGSAAPHEHSSAAAHSHHANHEGQTALPALPAAVELQECWVRALPTPLPAAAYLQIHNRSDSAMTLQGVQAPGFGQTMLHSTVTEQGMARMVHQDHIVVPPKDSVALAPGGLHIMLEQPEHTLQPGKSLPLSLRFQGYAAREVQCEIRSARG